MKNKHYRVAQWATGNVGTRALQAIIEHPWLDLVALRVYSDEKVGRDAGELCNLEPVGVTASRDIEDVLRAKPDCVVYMPAEHSIDDMCRLLEAGSNIATSCFGFSHRDSLAPNDRAKLEAACERGQTSFFATGSTPGWSTEIMPVPLLAMSRRLDSITLTEFADMSSRNSPEMLFDLLDFGADPATLDPNAPHPTSISTPPTLRATASALGLPLDEVVCTKEYALTQNPVEIPAGRLEAGTVGAMCMQITGMHQGRELIRRRTTWYVTRDIEPAWDLRDTGWHYRIESDTPLDVMITVPANEADYPRISPGFTAHPVINAIPNVCNARPGIRELYEMDPLVPVFF